MWIVLVTLLSLPAFASGEGYGNVGGRVLDQTGRPLPGVSVALASTETTLTATSELDGISVSILSSCSSAMQERRLPAARAVAWESSGPTTGP